MYLIIALSCIIPAILAYLLGSINTAIIVTKIVTKGGNIKEMGSGNAGFTNVLRCVGKVPAIITIVCDFLKAVVAVLLSNVFIWVGVAVFTSIFYSSDAQVFLATNQNLLVEGTSICNYVAGFCCILGHMFPIYFHFKGGKGVVAAIGMIFVLDWRTFLIILGIFLIIFLCSKIISLGSLICAGLYGPITFLVTYFFEYKNQTTQILSLTYVFIVSAIALLTGVVVIIKHHENIGRLIRGEEKKIKAKK